MINVDFCSSFTNLVRFISSAIRILAMAAIISSCGNNNNKDTITFAVSADYPPFEYRDRNDIVGFDIDVANLIAHRMKKKAIFRDMHFSAILASIKHGHVDAAISTITITEDRKINFDFSDTYYKGKFAAVFKDPIEIKDQSDLSGKKIACQLGTSMAIWLEKNKNLGSLIIVDSINSAIESLKTGHVEVVVLDSVQAVEFCKTNSDIKYSLIGEDEFGYAIALPKESKLLTSINEAIRHLKETGEIKKLEEKWITSK